MNPRRWFREHSIKLLAIRDTPEAIAGGVAIGLFFGFTPLFGLKTMAAMLFAWLTRSNILAAVIAVTLHDLVLPLMPFIFRWEYCLGYWLLSNPHHWPERLARAHWVAHPWGLHWGNWRAYGKRFSVIGKPLLLGSAVLGLPLAVVSFYVTKLIVARHHKKHPHLSSENGVDNPS
jgi:uncharacterized protein (DUF2062 family)